MSPPGRPAANGGATPVEDVLWRIAHEAGEFVAAHEHRMGNDPRLVIRITDAGYEAFVEDSQGFFDWLFS